MSVIKSNRGVECLVSDEDYEYLSQWSWQMRSGYLSRCESYRENGKKKERTLMMHRIINKTPKGLMTDHINGNKLDNRRENLRTVTNSQNQMNRIAGSRSRTGIKGVGFCKQTKKWKASMSVNGIQKHFGRFDCIGKAIKAYNEAAIKYHGEYARLNRST